MTGSAPFLTLTMIARDAERTIGRALESAGPLVDGMVVVDTGSTDDTVGVARAHGASVRRFPWIEDFSAARNFALASSKARWNLVLDADSWIHDGEAGLLDALRAQDSTGAGGWADVVLGSEWQPTMRSARVLGSSVRYRGRVHEQPWVSGASFGAGLVIRNAPDAPGETARRQARDTAALQRAVAEGSDADGYHHFLLGNCLAAQNRLAEAVDAYEDADLRTPSHARWRPQLVARYVMSLNALGAVDEARLLVRQARRDLHDPEEFAALLAGALPTQRGAAPAA